MKRLLLLLLAIAVVGGGVTAVALAASEDDPGPGAGFVDYLVGEGYIEAVDGEVLLAGLAEIRNHMASGTFLDELHSLRGTLEDAMSAAAGALGLSVEDLEARLDAGEPIAAIAAELGVPLDDVVDAVMGPIAQRVEEARADGTISDEAADSILERARDGVARMLESGFGARHHAMAGGMPGFPLDAVADLLGIEVEALIEELESGRSIADVAADQGIAVEDLIDDLVVALTEGVRERVESWVNGEIPEMGSRHGPGMRGPGHFEWEGVMPEGFFFGRGPFGFGELPEELGELPEEMRQMLEEMWGGELPDIEEFLDGFEFEWEGEMPEGFFHHGPVGFGELPEELGELPEEMRQMLEEMWGGELPGTLDEFLDGFPEGHPFFPGPHHFQVIPDSEPEPATGTSA